MIILKAQFAGRLVPQFDQPFEIAFEQLPKRLARFPGGAALGRVGRGFENVADFVVGQFLAADLRAIGVELLLDGVLRVRSFASSNFGIDLLRQIVQIKHFDLPGQERIGNLRRLDRFQLARRFSDSTAERRVSSRLPPSAENPRPCR